MARGRRRAAPLYTIIYPPPQKAPQAKILAILDFIFSRNASPLYQNHSRRIRLFVPFF